MFEKKKEKYFKQDDGIFDYIIKENVYAFNSTAKKNNQINNNNSSLVNKNEKILVQEEDQGTELVNQKVLKYANYTQSRTQLQPDLVANSLNKQEQYKDQELHWVNFEQCRKNNVNNLQAKWYKQNKENVTKVVHQDKVYQRNIKSFPKKALKNNQYNKSTDKTIQILQEDLKQQVNENQKWEYEKINQDKQKIEGQIITKVGGLLKDSQAKPEQIVEQHPVLLKIQDKRTSKNEYQFFNSTQQRFQYQEKEQDQSLVNNFSLQRSIINIALKRRQKMNYKYSINTNKQELNLPYLLLNKNQLFEKKSTSLIKRSIIWKTNVLSKHKQIKEQQIQQSQLKLQEKNAYQTKLVTLYERSIHQLNVFKGKETKINPKDSIFSNLNQKIMNKSEKVVPIKPRELQTIHQALIIVNKKSVDLLKTVAKKETIDYNKLFKQYNNANWKPFNSTSVKLCHN